jgi:hypothetical protein
MQTLHVPDVSVSFLPAMNQDKQFALPEGMMWNALLESWNLRQ